MGVHVTKYKTENGKTRKIKDNKTSKNGAAGSTSGADKNSQQTASAKQGA
jgi:hypothetical protein